MALLFEMFMVILFGVSWPVNIMKSIKSKSTKGKSALFLCFILIGYIFGILSKIVSNNINYVFFFYIINLIMVTFDLILFFRNRALERK
jgi:hypothetical protein